MTQTTHRDGFFNYYSFCILDYYDFPTSLLYKDELVNTWKTSLKITMYSRLVWTIVLFGGMIFLQHKTTKGKWVKLVGSGKPQ